MPEPVNEIKRAQDPKPVQEPRKLLPPPEVLKQVMQSVQDNYLGHHILTTAQLNLLRDLEERFPALEDKMQALEESVHLLRT